MLKRVLCGLSSHPNFEKIQKHTKIIPRKLWFDFVERYSTKGAWMKLRMRMEMDYSTPLLTPSVSKRTIQMKISWICMKMNFQVKLIFTWKVLHLASFWNRGHKELGNGPLGKLENVRPTLFKFNNIVIQVSVRLPQIFF